MMENINAFKATVTAVLVALTALWGWFGWLVLAWVACMAIDVITGMMAAAQDGPESRPAHRSESPRCWSTTL